MENDKLNIGWKPAEMDVAGRYAQRGMDKHQFWFITIKEVVTETINNIYEIYVYTATILNYNPHREINCSSIK